MNTPVPQPIIEPQVNGLLQTLAPTYLQIINESAGHGGYFVGKESHFKVIIASDAFNNLSQVKRHQLVYQTLGNLITDKKIHALAIHAYAPNEWQGQAPDSPNCAHAAKA